MQDPVIAAEGGPQLSQVERVVDTFVAPSKTFTDILRSTNWLLPFVLAVLVTFASSFAIDKKIGFDRVAEHEMTKSPKAAERMEQLPPEQREKQVHMSGVITRYSTYASGIFILLFCAVWALLLWASFNFVLGASTTYGQMFAVTMFASLPRLLSGILNVVLLYAGVNTDNYDIRNPVGTNIGYYIQDPAWLKAALSFFDVIGIWSLVLTVIGTAIVARVPTSKAATVVVGWWLFAMVLLTGVAAVFG